MGGHAHLLLPAGHRDDPALLHAHPRTLPKYLLLRQFLRVIAQSLHLLPLLVCGGSSGSQAHLRHLLQLYQEEPSTTPNSKGSPQDFLPGQARRYAEAGHRRLQEGIAQGEEDGNPDQSAKLLHLLHPPAHLPGHCLPGRVHPLLQHASLLDRRLASSLKQVGINNSLL